MMVAVFGFFYAAAYVALSAVSVVFFEQRVFSMRRISAYSIAILAASIVGVFALVALIPDIELGNRFQHAVGGGVLGIVLCYLVFRDQQIKTTRFQFFVWSVLVVTALGVGNELFEFVVQSNTHLVFSDNPFDTWRDMASNTVGIALAAPVATLLRSRV